MGRFHGRPRIAWYDRGPGPAGYGLPPLVGKPKHAVTHRINPEYSFGHKLDKEPPRIGPGPGCYAIRYGLKAKGYDAGFKYTMRKKPEDRIKSDSPAPNVYQPGLPHKPRAPQFTMRARLHPFRRPQTPGPNAYQLPPMLGPKIANKLAAPECTLKGVPELKSKTKTPGPYDVGPPELIKRRAPGYTMRIKWPELRSQSGNAGPASYNVNRVCCRHPPAWQFGIKYNDFTGIFTTGCDKLRYDSIRDVCG